MSSETDTPTRKPLKLSSSGKLELKKTVDGGQVRQSFPHGRSKTVAVEVKKKRTYTTGARRHGVEAAPEIEVKAPRPATAGARGRGRCRAASHADRSGTAEPPARCWSRPRRTKTSARSPPPRMRVCCRAFRARDAPSSTAAAARKKSARQPKDAAAQGARNGRRSGGPGSAGCGQRAADGAERDAGWPRCAACRPHASVRRPWRRSDAEEEEDVAAPHHRPSPSCAPSRRRRAVGEDQRGASRRQDVGDAGPRFREWRASAVAGGLPSPDRKRKARHDDGQPAAAESAARSCRCPRRLLFRNWPAVWLSAAPT